MLAHYEPYSLTPMMSVPALRLFQRLPRAERRSALEGCETYAIGAWFPEFEFTHYLATEVWKRLMDDCDIYFAIAGNALSATPYYQTGRPFLAWLAAGWNDDRKDRTRVFPRRRRIFDRAFVKPFAMRLETAILQSGSILSVSQYTKGVLERTAGTGVVKAVLSMPIDSDVFSPAPCERVRGRIGFCGRIHDPRKNLKLLFESLAHMRKSGARVTALLVGGKADDKVRYQIEQLAIGDAVEFRPYLTPERLRDQLRTLDVFVVPSHQEGLCIAALEAMACGCPVVSTRCGGPEEFVISGETGLLVGFDPIEMADAVTKIMADDGFRQRLTEGARALVLKNYSNASSEAVFWTAFAGLFK